MKWYERWFDYLTYLVILLYFALFFGFWSEAPDYLNAINFWRQALIGFLLVYFFNPWRKLTFTSFHRKLAFASGIFLFGASALMEIRRRVDTIASPVVRELLPHL